MNEAGPLFPFPHPGQCLVLLTRYKLLIPPRSSKKFGGPIFYYRAPNEEYHVVERIHYSIVVE